MCTNLTTTAAPRVVPSKPWNISSKWAAWSRTCPIEASKQASEIRMLETQTGERNFAYYADPRHAMVSRLSLSHKIISMTMVTDSSSQEPPASQISVVLRRGCKWEEAVLSLFLVWWNLILLPPVPFFHGNWGVSSQADGKWALQEYWCTNAPILFGNNQRKAVDEWKK